MRQRIKLNRYFRQAKTTKVQLLGLTARSNLDSAAGFQQAGASRAASFGDRF
jgi:hypothetical protein